MARKKTIKLPVHGITLKLVEQGSIEPDGPKWSSWSGTITSNLHEDGESEILKAAIDGVESFILAAACAGLNIETPQFLEAIETTVDAISNQYGDLPNLELLALIAQDTKKAFHYSKDENRWYWCDRDESDNIDAYQGPHDTYFDALVDATEPYVNQDED